MQTIVHLQRDYIRPDGQENLWWFSSGDCAKRTSPGIAQNIAIRIARLRSIKRYKGATITNAFYCLILTCIGDWIVVLRIITTAENAAPGRLVRNRSAAIFQAVELIPI